MGPRLEPCGTLVVGGRLKHSEINDEVKHSIILPYTHRMTDAVIEQYHFEVGHRSISHSL